LFSHIYFITKFFIRIEIKALRNGVADFTLRNVEHSRNTDENILLVELNALAFTNTPIKKIKTKWVQKNKKKN